MVVHVIIYSGTDTRGSKEFIPNFSFRQFDMVQKLNNCTCMHNLKPICCPLLSDCLPKSIWGSPLSKLAVSDSPRWINLPWPLLCCSFCDSVRWKILLGFLCRNRLLLTGTPIQNSMAEVCACLNFSWPTCGLAFLFFHLDTSIWTDLVVVCLPS